MLFNCDEADRVGPVRSIRTTDPEILAPFSEHPLLAFSGGSKGVRTIVEDAGMTAMDEDSAAKAFTRDDARVVPHNLFTSTKPLWAKGKSLAKDEPAPVVAVRVQRRSAYAEQEGAQRDGGVLRPGDRRVALVQGSVGPLPRRLAR